MRNILLTALAVLLVATAVAQEEERKIVQFGTVYSALPWLNAEGGEKEGFVYMDNLDFTANLNIDRIFKWENDLILFAYVLSNHGGQASSLMGDFQVASNIEAPRSTRLFELWVQENFFHNDISVLVGLYDLNSEFDVLRPGTIFINSSFGIGAEYAQSGVNGPSIFPISSLGFRMSAQLGDKAVLRIAALDGVPGDAQDPTSNRIRLTTEEGALLAVETSIYPGSTVVINPENVERGYVTRRKKVGREHEIPTNDKINLGGWYYTAKFPELNSPYESHGNWGVYAGMQKYFHFGREGRYLALFGRYGVANATYNQLQSALSGGVVFSDLIQDKTDYLGLAFSTGYNGKPYLNAMQPEESPLRAETVVEFTYSISLANWFSIQPDVQYMINPGMRRSLNNSLGIGLLLQVSI